MAKTVKSPRRSPAKKPPAARRSTGSPSPAKAAPRASSGPSAAAAAPPLTTNRISTYSVHSGVLMVQNWIAGLKEKTGRTLDEWIAYLRKAGPKDEKGRREWLKSEHKMGSNTAWWLAERSMEGRMGITEEDPDVYLANAVQYVTEMYEGGKAGLRPLHDALIKLGQSIGKEVRFCPCKTIVPVYRNHVIAQIKPTTRTRIDFGLALGDTKATGRLIDTGGFAKKDRITHRIEITSMADINDEVRRWFKVAYDRDAK